MNISNISYTTISNLTSDMCAMTPRDTVSGMIGDSEQALVIGTLALLALGLVAECRSTGRYELQILQSLDRFIADVEGQDGHILINFNAISTAEKGMKCQNESVRVRALVLFGWLVTQNYSPAYEPAFAAAQQGLKSSNPLHRSASSTILQTLVTRHYVPAYTKALAAAAIHAHSVLATAQQTGGNADANTCIWAYTILRELVMQEHVPSYKPACAIARRAVSEHGPLHGLWAFNILQALVLKAHVPSYAPALAFAQSRKESGDAQERIWAYELFKALVFAEHIPPYPQLMTAMIASSPTYPREQRLAVGAQLMASVNQGDVASYAPALDVAARAIESAELDERICAYTLLRALVGQGEGRELALAAVARGETSTDIHEHTAAGLLRDALLPL